MTWDEVWPLLLAAVGVGLGILVVEILYRICRGLIRLAWKKTKGTEPADQEDQEKREAGPAEQGKQERKRHGRFSDSLLDRVYRPVQVLAAAGGALVPLRAADTEQDALVDALLLVMAIAAGWLVIVAVLWLVAAGTSFLRFGGSDAARRFRSQVDTFSRALGLVAFGGILVAVVVSVELGGTFLAVSAGIGAIFGLAAQNALTNVFTGIAIGFSGRANIGDVVEVGGEAGEIIERTLTHVVLKLFPERHLVIPSSSFLSQAHTNWRITRNLVVGWVPLEVGWKVPLKGLKDELKKAHETIIKEKKLAVVKERDLDEKLWVEVVGVTDTAVRVRAKVIAVPDDLWDAQCKVRDHLIKYLNEQEESLPYTRVTLLDSGDVGTGSKSGSKSGRDPSGPPRQHPVRTSKGKSKVDSSIDDSDDSDDS